MVGSTSSVGLPTPVNPKKDLPKGLSLRLTILAITFEFRVKIFRAILVWDLRDSGIYPQLIDSVYYLHSISWFGPCVAFPLLLSHLLGEPFICLPVKTSVLSRGILIHHARCTAMLPFCFRAFWEATRKKLSGDRAQLWLHFPLRGSSAHSSSASFMNLVKSETNDKRQ